MDEIQAPDTFADPEIFSLERQKLARRRKIAQSLLAQPIEPIPGEMVGRFYVAPNVGQYINAATQKVLASRDDTRLDEEEAALARREGEMSNKMLSSIPSATKRVLGEDLSQGPSQEIVDNREARQAAQLQAMRNPSLRDIIKMQMLADENEAKREATQAEKEANRAWQEQQNQLYKRTLADAIALKQAPSVIVHTGSGRSAGGIKAPSGYRYNEDGTALEPIPGGPADKSGAGAKPLTNAQEKAALELGSEFATVNRLVSTFKPEYSGDLKSSITREFGKVAGGAAPQSVQDMTRWWSDQAMMDELPQRHALFGAALTATEQKSWKDAAISPNLAPDVIQKRLATRQQIMLDAAQRMKGSVEASGRSAKQFEAATGKLEPAKPAPTVVRTGTRNGVRVEQLSDGTIREVK